MGEWFQALSGFGQAMFVVAVIGSVFFVFKLVLMFMGIGGDLVPDADGADADGLDSDGDADADDGDHTAAAEALHLFSVHGLALALAMGGWSALGVYSATDLAIVAAPVGLVVGFVAMVFHAWCMRQVLKLQEDPTIDHKNAVGLTGRVYLRIPAHGEGSGKIQLVLHESLEEFEAVSQDPEPIPTGEEVRVVGLSDEGKLVVQRLSEENDALGLEPETVPADAISTEAKDPVGEPSYEGEPLVPGAEEKSGVA